MLATRYGFASGADDAVWPEGREQYPDGVDLLDPFFCQGGMCVAGYQMRVATLAANNDVSIVFQIFAVRRVPSPTTELFVFFVRYWKHFLGKGVSSSRTEATHQQPGPKSTLILETDHTIRTTAFDIPVAGEAIDT